MLTPAIFRPLYLAMVRPHPDYALQTSFPYLQKDIKIIKRMRRVEDQRRLEVFDNDCLIRILGCSSFRRDVCRLSDDYRIQHTSMSSKFPRCSDTFSVLLSSWCTGCSTVT